MALPASQNSKGQICHWQITDFGIALTSMRSAIVASSLQGI
jgi:hypothetical protein